MSVAPLLATTFGPEDIVLIVVIAVLLAGSGVLAMAETSLVRMSKIKAKSLVDEGRRGARQLARLVEDPANFLNPILLLVLICQLVSATLVGIVAEHLFGPWGVLLGIVFEVVVIFVFFEAVPKNWAVLHADRAALLAAPIVSALTRFPPIRWLSTLLIGLANRIIGVTEDEEDRPHSFITDSELKAMADVAHEEHVIEKDERTFIHSIIDFGDTVAREVMVPRPDMVTVAAEVALREAADIATTAGFSRIPVYGKGIDDIVGIAYLKDMMRAEREGRDTEPVSACMREAQFVPETKRVAEVMREMQAGKQHLAIVVDEYGGTAGLITLEDVLEELVGEISDEYDIERPRLEHLEGGEVQVDGGLSIDELNELTGFELPEGDWDTVGGLLYNLLGHVPVEGEVAEFEGRQLVAQKVDGRRIAQVLIKTPDGPSSGDEPSPEGPGGPG